MKKFVLFLLMTISYSLHAGIVTTLDDATTLAQEQLRAYLNLDTDEEILDFLDEDSMEVIELICSNGQQYEYIKIYAGETENGGVFIPKSSELVGENSDGDFYIYGERRAKVWLDCSEITTI